MDRVYVDKEWIDRKVVLIPLDERGTSGYELQGWLRGIEDDGIVFAKAFYSDSLKKQMPEIGKFWPWERIGYLEPLTETE